MNMVTTVYAAQISAGSIVAGLIGRVEPQSTRPASHSKFDNLTNNSDRDNLLDIIVKESPVACTNLGRESEGVWQNGRYFSGVDEGFEF